jgi:uncharacterized protein YaiE (UPF0345 family)
VEFRNAASGGSTFTIGHASATSPSATLNVTDAANLTFKTDDTERMRIDSSGNVGIGTSSPSAKLDLQGTAAGDEMLEITHSGASQPWKFISGESGVTNESLRISRGASGEWMRFHAGLGTVFYHDGTERMRIDSSGNVGIGRAATAVGSYKVLDIEGPVGGIINHYVGSTKAGQWYTGTGAAGFGTVTSIPLTFTTGNNERMRITSGGGVSVGTAGLPTSGNAGVSLQPAGNVHCGVATTAATDVMRFDNPNGRIGSITVTGTTTSYNTSSDYRLKENVTDVTDGITRVKQLSPKRFNFTADPDTTVDGFIAHEVQDVIPEAISGVKDAMRDEEYEVTPAVLDDDGNEVTPAVMGTRSVPDYQGIDQSKLVPLLTAALQEAITKIEDLEARVAALET